MRVIIDIEPGEVLVAIGRPEGYEDEHPELLATDALGFSAFPWRVIAVEEQAQEGA